MIQKGDAGSLITLLSSFATQFSLSCFGHGFQTYLLDSSTRNKPGWPSAWVCLIGIPMDANYKCKILSICGV